MTMEYDKVSYSGPGESFCGYSWAKDWGITWNLFSGHNTLMTISYCMEEFPRTVSTIWRMSDGFGAGFTGDYDWSGIRDSSPAAKKAMYDYAVGKLKGLPVPWEPNRKF